MYFEKKIENVAFIFSSFFFSIRELRFVWNDIGKPRKKGPFFLRNLSENKDLC